MRQAKTHVRGRGTKERTAQLGKSIYERDIKKQVESAHHGKYVSIDIDTGNWTISDDLLTAANLLREQCPEVVDVWSVKVGYKALHHFGGRPLRGSEWSKET